MAEEIADDLQAGYGLLLLGAYPSRIYLEIPVLERGARAIQWATQALILRD